MKRNNFTNELGKCLLKHGIQIMLRYMKRKREKIPDKYNTLILSEVMENSKIMQLAKYEEMTDKEKEI